MEINDILKNVEIVVSIFALVCAFMAYRQSLKARRYSSFETIFAQMLSEQRSFFENQHMLNAERRPLTDEFVSMFDYLIKLNSKTSSETNSQTHSSIYGNILKIKRLDSEIAKLDSEIAKLEVEIKEPKNKKLIYLSNTLSLKEERKKILTDKRSKLDNERNKYHENIPQDCYSSNISTENLASIYRDFTNEIENVEYFKNSFKFIYNIVKLVEDSEIDKKDKQPYIDRIQALLNRNEMFCYFVNLVEFHKEFLRNNIDDETHYISRLKKYKFFKDLDDRDGRFHEILGRIDEEVKKKFGILIKQDKVNVT